MLILPIKNFALAIVLNCCDIKRCRVHFQSIKQTKARFKRRISHAPNTMLMVNSIVLPHLHCIRRMRNATFETGLSC